MVRTWKGSSAVGLPQQSRRRTSNTRLMLAGDESPSQATKGAANVDGMLEFPQMAPGCTAIAKGEPLMGVLSNRISTCTAYKNNLVHEQRAQTNTIVHLSESAAAIIQFLLPS
jgi:hypothetical protein